MAKKALILDNKVVDVVDTEFDVHSDLTWMDCTDDCVAGMGWTVVSGVLTAPAAQPAVTYSTKRRQKYKALGKVDFTAEIKGVITNEILPIINATFSIELGSLEELTTNTKINNINLEGLYISSLEKLDIKSFSAFLDNDRINGNFNVLNFSQPKLNGNLVCDLSLEKLALLLFEKSSWKIKIAGHTDSYGRASSNLRLSKKRAQAVADFLIKNNILEDRIQVEWFGETKPIDSNKTKAGRSKNRRVEMEIL